MIHHYLKKGIPDEYILNLSPLQKHFYKSSMILEFEEEAERAKALTGGQG